MDNFIIVDIETGGFDVISGIFEVSALVVENMEIKDKIHIGIVYDESLIQNGYGDGYEEISYNKDCISKFKKFISQYNYPIVAHNANFDRKFLVYYDWLDEEYEVYDSMRAIKYEMPYLFSYSMSYLLDYFELDKIQSHTAIDDVLDLYNILKIVSPKTWLPVGVSKKRQYKKINKVDIDKESIEIIGDIFKDKNIVFTGKGPYKRSDLSVIAMKYGANVLNGVNKKTDILVVGEDAGSKLQKANDLGIEILSIDDFMDITSDTVIDIDTNKEINKNDCNKKSSLSKYGFTFNAKHLEGLTISLIPMRLKMAEKISDIVNKLGGTPILSFRQKETNLLIYEKYGEDFVTVNKAKSKGIKTISLAEFNKLMLEDKLNDFISSN